MSETKSCGNCKHFKDEDAEGKGYCENFHGIFRCDEVCVVHDVIDNGWTEITPGNVDEVRKTDVGRLMIAVITHGELYYMEYREMFRELDEMAERGGYFYYVLPELKIE